MMKEKNFCNHIVPARTPRHSAGILSIEHRNSISLTFKMTIMSIKHNRISVLGQVQNVVAVASGYHKETVALLINQRYSIYHRHHYYYHYH
jgi:hypothetical protein